MESRRYSDKLRKKRKKCTKIGRWEKGLKEESKRRERNEEGRDYKKRRVREIEV